MSGRLSLLAVAFALLLSCTQTPRPSDGGDSRTGATRLLAPTAATTPSAASKTTTPITVLRIEEDLRRLEIKPLGTIQHREAATIRSSDGKYALEVEPWTFGPFVVRDVSTHRVAAKGPGWFARWVSETEVVSLDAAGSLTRIDLANPSKATQGGTICRDGLTCLPNRPTLEWVSRDFDRAVVRGASNEPFVLRKGEIAPLLKELEDEPGLKVTSLGVSKNGSVCALMGRDTERAHTPDANLEGNLGRLRCAEPPWITWRRVRDFSVERPLEMEDLHAHVQFFSEREVLVSLPPPRTHSNPFDHIQCIVTLETAAARCTPAARPAWYALGDGRWLIEHAVIGIAQARLVDTAHGRSWAIGDDTRAAWWAPQPDARAPGTLVLQRLDKSDVRAGSVVLPSEP